MKKVLVIVDMQNDFVDGALGTPEAQAIVPKVADYIREHVDENTVLLITKDTHNTNYMETLEGKNLPVAHCIKNTHGWELAPAIQEAIYDTREKYNSFDSYFPYVGDHIIEKPTFGSVDFQNLLYVLDEDTYTGRVGQVEEITLMGLCTGICVLSNAILAKATFPEVPVRVVADCCACVTPTSHQTALDAMKLCQIEIV
jgi:nicotinamidase-related amidase